MSIQNYVNKLINYIISAKLYLTHESKRKDKRIVSRGQASQRDYRGIEVGELRHELQHYCGIDL